MSSLTLGSNISALRATRDLRSSTARLSQNFERLSSGMRINRASDDPAGLVLSQKLNMEKRVYAQGIKNLNDGISLLNIAEAAINELSNITNELVGLAQQASNGALSATMRKAVDADAQALKEEFTRITKTAEFNGKSLFNPDFGLLRLQAGFGESGGFSSGLGGATGDGTFANRQIYAVGNQPYNITAGDLNGNGEIDIITSNVVSGTISVLIGTGDGNFQSAGSYALAGNNAQGITVGDLNGNGVLDVITADTASGAVSVLLGNGDGTFGTASAFAVGTAPRSVVLGDFNGNGILDLVTSNSNDNNVSVLLGNGDGTFGAQTTYATGLGSFSVRVGDFNGNGILDIVTANPDSGNISVLLGNGDGTFGAQTSFNAGGSAQSVVVGDVNGNGILDVVTANTGNNTVSVMLGDGNGGFGGATTFSTGAGNSPTSLKLGDLNGNGVLDIVTSNSSGSVSVLMGNGGGSFGAASVFTVGSNPFSVVLADFNGNGVLDIATGDTFSNAVSVLFANTRDGMSPILDFSLKTQADARQAVTTLNKKVQSVSLHRGQIGAFQSRTDFALNYTTIKTENISVAASRITDVDVAQEATEMVRNQLLQQSASAVLVQANMQPRLVLSLLSGLKGSTLAEA